jgi:hypothetical protein
MTPRWSISSSTSRKLSGKRKYSHTQWEITSTGYRCPLHDGDALPTDDPSQRDQPEDHPTRSANAAPGNVLDILVQNRRDKTAARRFFSRLIKKTRWVPRVVVTDKLHSYGAARREAMPSVEHCSHKGLNNRAENSHQPTRQRERAIKGFRSAGAAHQRFLSAFSASHPTSGPTAT